MASVTLHLFSENLNDKHGLYLKGDAFNFSDVSLFCQTIHHIVCGLSDFDSCVHVSADCTVISIDGNV